MKQASSNKGKICLNFLLIFLLLSILISCNKKSLSEQTPPFISLPSKQKDITTEAVHENIVLENLLKMIDNNIIVNKLDKSKCYAVILNDSLSLSNDVYKYISLFINRSIPVVEEKDLKDILKINKELVILEIRYENRNRKVMVKVAGYSAYLMKHIFTFDYETNIDYLKEIEKEKKGEKLYSEGEKERSELIGLVNGKVLAIKVDDYNADQKKDLLLLAPTKVYYWLMAYNIVLKEKIIPIDIISEIKSKDLAGLIIKNMNSLYLINSNMLQGLCIYNNDDVRNCELKEIDLFKKKGGYDLVNSLGTNWFKLIISEEKDILFHTLYYIPPKMDASLEKTDNQGFIYYLGLDNRIYRIENVDLEHTYITPFKSGRAFSANDEYLITTSSNTVCPPDSINIYRKQNEEFSFLLAIKNDNDCITAIDIEKGNNKELIYYYSVYDKKRDVSKIIHERTRID